MCAWPGGPWALCYSMLKGAKACAPGEERVPILMSTERGAGVQGQAGRVSWMVWGQHCQWTQGESFGAVAPGISRLSGSPFPYLQSGDRSSPSFYDCWRVR